MDQIIQQVLTIITTSPGNLTYHLVLAFSVAGALQAALTNWRASGYPQGRRMVIGLAVLLLIQVLLFASVGLTWQGLFTIRSILPPLDRAVSLFSLVMIIWLWVYPESNRLADAITFLLFILASTFFAYSLVWWNGQDTSQHFNITDLDFMAESAALVLLILGALLLAIRRPNGWGIGLAMFTLLLTGHIVHWWAPLLDSDYPGAVRLAQMAAYPLLLALPSRFSLFAGAESSDKGVVTTRKGRENLVQQLAQVYFSLPSGASVEQASQELTRLIAKLMPADICLLLSPPDGDNLVSSLSAYDQSQERYLPAFTVEERWLPVLSNALRRGRYLRLPASSTSPDLVGLGKALGLPRTGPLMAVPVAEPGSAIIAGVVLLSPYSNRGWATEDQIFLANATETLARILQRLQQPRVSSREPALRTGLLIDQATGGEPGQQEEYQTLLEKVENLKSQLTQEKMRAESLAALIADQESEQTSVETVVQAHPQAVATPNSVISESPDTTQDAALEQILQLELELAQARSEADSLRGLLSSASNQTELRKMKEQVAPGNPIDEITAVDWLNENDTSQITPSGETQRSQVTGPEELGEIATIAHELRQPMSSLMGYTDLLLGESVGILGAKQRKFLERIKASSERMGGLIDDLLRKSAPNNGTLSLSHEWVDLNSVIDEAIASTIDHLREKNITLRVDLPDELPRLKADRDALQQVLLHLIQNAGSATPVEGEITLRAQVETKRHEPGYILIQVSDTGSGIPAEDLPRVFSRLYRDSSGSIQGLGESGVGLSIARTLVENLGGRIWVDSEAGHGSTFSILLPLSEGLTSEEESGEVVG